MADEIRIGVLGAARIAPAAAIKPSRAVPGVRVTAVAARDRSRAYRFAAKWGVDTVHDDYESLVADPAIDAVYNPLPNGLHGAWTVAALEAGKHVLCEKPFTANALEARDVADVATRTGLVCMEAWHWRYHPLADRLLEIVSSGEIGAIERIESTFCAPIPKRSDIRWQLDLAGGSLMDMGSYPVSLVRVMTGEEPEVVSVAHRTREPGVDRYLRAELRFDSGVTALVRCGMLSGRVLDATTRIAGTRGSIRVFNPFAPQYRSKVRVRGARGHRSESPTRQPTYEFQLAAFRDAVRTGAPVLTGTEFAVANMAAIDRIYEAAGLGRRVPTPLG